ncbi:calcium-binding protein [Phaeobacter marinintestinus]|uniref:calcium-binding protein n=1 Tax=Falsiphaeobacter marinintestinus TaxID=1492905 RepID=UPI0011B740F6|nr:calcium-binding protein [Phaeobacter marinintestinus]
MTVVIARDVWGLGLDLRPDAFGWPPALFDPALDVVEMAQAPLGGDLVRYRFDINWHPRWAGVQAVMEDTGLTMTFIDATYRTDEGETALTIRENTFGVACPIGPGAPPCDLSGAPSYFVSNGLLQLDGNDVLIGNAFVDRLYGYEGHDVIRGGNGSDQLDGGDGHDRIFGEGGSDRARGGSGTDQLSGGAGNDVLNGGDGDDALNGGADNDQLTGGLGNDSLRGEIGDDMLMGKAGHDFMHGGAGNDLMDGGGGNDGMVGDGGNDVMTGGAGNDVLDGSFGNDTLTGGAGDDRLTGGPGADIFVFEFRGGHDIVMDFTPGIDGINLLVASPAEAVDTADGALMIWETGSALFLGVLADDLPI